MACFVLADLLLQSMTQLRDVARVLMISEVEVFPRYDRRGVSQA